MLFQGKLRQTVCWITSQDKGGLLQPTDINSKTGKLVSKDLISKHPDPSQPPELALEDYDTLPAMMEVDIATNTIMKVAAKMQGAAGPDRANLIVWHDWVLYYGEASYRLQESVNYVA
eukprot:10846860-Ditylum_brightwellii.AAC.1